MEGEDSGIDKDDASADNEVTSDRSSGQSVTAYVVVIEWQWKGTLTVLLVLHRVHTL